MFKFVIATKLHFINYESTLNFSDIPHISVGSVTYEAGLT